MSEKYPILYFTGKLNEVFPIVINVNIEVSSAGKMLPWSRDIFICSWKCFRHNNYELKFSRIRRLAGNNCIVYSGDFIQRAGFSHSGYLNKLFSGQTIRGKLLSGQIFTDTKVKMLNHLRKSQWWCSNSTIRQL